MSIKSKWYSDFGRVKNYNSYGLQLSSAHSNLLSLLGRYPHSQSSIIHLFLEFFKKTHDFLHVNL